MVHFFRPILFLVTGALVLKVLRIVPAVHDFKRKHRHERLGAGRAELGSGQIVRVGSRPGRESMARFPTVRQQAVAPFKRADVVLIIAGIFFVFEFKVGSRHFETAAVDLKNFHAGSHDRRIVPVVVATMDAPD